jgi:hypothetical protein
MSTWFITACFMFHAFTHVPFLAVHTWIKAAKETVPTPAQQKDYETRSLRLHSHCILQQILKLT